MYSIYLLFGVYFLVMLGIFLYSIGVLDVLLSYFLKPTNADRKTWTDWPTVTIQLPVFNEKYVVEDLIDAIAQLDYPWEKLEVQLLDDSDIRLAHAALIIRYRGPPTRREYDQIEQGQQTAHEYGNDQQQREI